MAANATELWQLEWDMNGDGVFTISDAYQWLEWGFFLPGDFVLSILMMTPVGRFFEITPEWQGGWVSGVGSAVFWWAAILLVSYLFAELSN